MSGWTYFARVSEADRLALERAAAVVGENPGEFVRRVVRARVRRVLARAERQLDVSPEAHEPSLAGPGDAA